MRDSDDGNRSSRGLLRMIKGNIELSSIGKGIACLINQWDALTFKSIVLLLVRKMPQASPRPAGRVGATREQGIN